MLYVKETGISSGHLGLWLSSALLPLYSFFGMCFNQKTLFSVIASVLYEECVVYYACYIFFFETMFFIVMHMFDLQACQTRVKFY